MFPSLYQALLFVHVLAAVALVGNAFVMPVLMGSVRDASTYEELRLRLDLARRAGRWNPAAAMTLLGTGFYLGSAGWWSLPWFWVGFAAWLANSMLAVRVVEGTAGAISRAAEPSGDGPVTGEADRLRRAALWHYGAGAMLANGLAAFYVMMQKPSLLVSCAALVLANVVVAGIRAAARGRDTSRAGMESRTA